MPQNLAESCSKWQTVHRDLGPAMRGTQFSPDPSSAELSSSYTRAVATTNNKVAKDKAATNPAITGNKLEPRITRSATHAALVVQAREKTESRSIVLPQVITSPPLCGFQPPQCTPAQLRKTSPLLFLDIPDLTTSSEISSPISHSENPRPVAGSINAPLQPSDSLGIDIRVCNARMQSIWIRVCDPDKGLVGNTVGSPESVITTYGAKVNVAALSHAELRAVCSKHIPFERTIDRISGSFDFPEGRQPNLVLLTDTEEVEVWLMALTARANPVPPLEIVVSLMPANSHRMIDNSGHKSQRDHHEEPSQKRRKYGNTPRLPRQQDHPNHPITQARA